MHMYIYIYEYLSLYIYIYIIYTYMGVVPNSGSQIQGAESAPIINFLTFGQHSPQV